jgi:very-short-patch-repair endonuclease
MGASDLKVREQWLLDRANAQHGLLRDSDFEGWLGRNGVARRCQARRLTRLYPGVYAFGHSALRDEGQWLAAFWGSQAPGTTTALSHLTAARFHGWRVPDDDERVHLTTTGTWQHPALAVHRSRNLERVDVLSGRLMHVTHPPRTLVDLADILPWAAYRQLADSLKTLPVAAIRAAQRRAPNRAGTPLVTRLLEADEAHTRSTFERRFLAWLRRRGLPRPDHLNSAVAGHQADAVYAAERLVVELDGRRYHERRGQMRADRHRDTDYQLAGYLILRLVWDDLHDAESARTEDRLRRLLRL